MGKVQTISEKISVAKKIDFGTIFNDALNLYKKVWVQGILLPLFNFLVMLPLIIAVYLPLLTVLMSQSQRGYINPDYIADFFTDFSVLYIIILIVAVILLAAINLALNAGFYRIVKNIDHDKTINTSDFFYFMKGKYMMRLITLMLVSLVIAIPSALLCYIPLIYVMVPMSFFIVFFAFNPELSVGDILKLSFKLGNKKWGVTFGLLIVVGICVSILGTITCGLGYLFLTSFSYLPVYFIYKKVVGFDEAVAINNLEN